MQLTLVGVSHHRYGDSLYKHLRGVIRRTGHALTLSATSQVCHHRGATKFSHRPYYYPAMSHTQSPYIAITIFKYFTVVITFRQFVSPI